MTHPEVPDQQPTPDPGSASGEHTGAGEVIRFPHPRPAPDDAADTAPGQHPGQGPDQPPRDGGAAGQAATAAPDAGESEEAGERVLVDSPDFTRPLLLDTLRNAQRRPIFPGWVRSWEEFRDAARWVVGHYAHAGAYHAVRVPKYAVKVTFRAPRGAVRTLGAVSRWVADAEGAPVRAAAVRREDAELYLKLSRQRDARVRARAIVAAAVALLGIPTTAVLLVLAPEWARWGVLAGVVALFGVLGSPADRPLVSPAVVAPKAQKLTSEIVIRALGSLGIAEINKAVAKGSSGITFVAPITRDGPGWRADVELPYGVTVADVMDRRDRLASGLRRPLGCVWPEQAPDEHPGRLVLWVGDRDMRKARQPAWPLAKGGQADLFQPVPYGTDPRGRIVRVPVMFTNMLIGAIPRMGKTFALRVLVLAAMLDPRAELHVWELKGTGDLSCAESSATTYGSGADDDTLAACLAALRDMHADLDRRAKVIRGLPKSVCPENKVTPELAGRRELGLHPRVFVIDECQELFSHPEYGPEAERLAVAIIKRGPALGHLLWLGTQRPDAKSLPTGVSANVGTRFCLRVMGQVENDMILGTSMYKNGIRATMFTAEDKGIGWLVGHAPDPQIVRTFYLDGPAAERIAQRARALREAAGTLAGHAIGQAPARPAYDLLADILTVVPASEDKVWNETVVERLAALRPEVYGGWKPEQLTAALKPYGIKTDQIGRRIDGKTVNRRGIERQHIADTVAERNRRRASG